MREWEGTVRLVRLALRRDRVQLPVWIASLTALHVFSVQSMVALYGTEAERVGLATSVARSGVALMFNGLVSGTSLGAVTMSQTLLVMATGAAMMSTFCVVRHTRQDEEAGRTELLVANAVGRSAPLLAALAVVVLAAVVLGLANVVALAAFGLPMHGSALAGAAIASSGIAFGAAAAVAAQVATTSRAANGLAGAVVGAAFALRGVGDMFSSVDSSGVRVISGWPSWLSPLGWAQQVRPYDDDNWLPLLCLLAFAVTAAGAAFALLHHRDVGAGMLSTRNGPGHAGVALRRPLGLAWRLQRTTFVAWAATMAVLGLALGAMAQEVDDLVGTSDGTVDILEQFGGSGSLQEVYLAATVAMAGIAAAGYTIQAVMRLRHEEAAGTVEVVLATAVGRPRWVASHLLVATLGTVVLLTLNGAATGLAYGLTADDPLGRLVTYAWAGILQAPAALVLGGVALLLFGSIPRFSRSIAWGAYAACIAFGQMGEVMRLPDWILELSPFNHLAAVPVEPAAVAASALLSAIAAATAVLGTALFRNRDISVG